LREIQAAAMGKVGGALLRLDRFLDLARRLDDALLLEGPRWRQHSEHPVREPACIGCYSGDAAVLDEQLRDMFTRPKGPGLPQPLQPDGQLRAALLPHID